MTRSQAFLRVLVVLVVIVVVAAFALLRRGTLQVNAPEGISYCVSIDNDSCTPAQGVYEDKMKTGEHKLTIQREGYIDFVRQISIVRGQTAEVAPNFVFAPVLTELDWEPEYKLPAEVEDNQWLRLSEFCTGVARGTGSMLGTGTVVLLRNLPENLLSLNWHPSGKWALGEEEGISRNQFLIYKVDAAQANKLDVRVKGAEPLLGSESKFVFFWREVGGDSALGMADVESNEFAEVTELPEMDSGILYPAPLASGSGKVLLQNTSAGDNRDFYLIDLETGRRDKISFGGDALAAVWSPDARFILLFQRSEGVLPRVALFDMAFNEARDLGLVFVSNSVAWLPDGNSFVFVDGNSDNLSLYDVLGEKRTDLAVLPDTIGSVQAACASDKDLVLETEGGNLINVRFRE